MADEEKRDDDWIRDLLGSPEHLNFKMIERLTQKVDEINNATQDKIDFIVSQQAQFTANIQAHDERLANLENILTRLANFTLNGQAEVNAKLSALTDAQIKTEDSLQMIAGAQAKLAEAQAKLAEAQAHTDKRLDALIDIVREEREGRNGKS